MLRLLAAVLPLALAAAVSPMLLTEQTMLLAADDGRRRARLFAAGAVSTLVAVLLLLTLFGRIISLPTEPHLSAGLDIVLGVGLLLLAGVLFMRRRSNKTEEPPSEPQQPTTDDRPASALIGFGAFSMITNFTTLALITPIAKDIAASHADYVERLVVLIVVVGIVAVPLWLPLVMTRLAPGTALKALSGLQSLVGRYGARIVELALRLAGIYLVTRGVIARFG